METYWMGQFCFDRKRRPKSLAEITESEIKKFKGGASNDLASG